MTTLTTDDREILNRIQKSPVFKKAEEEAGQEKKAKRKKLFDERRALLEESKTNDFLQAEKIAGKERDDASLVLKAAEERFISAWRARTAADFPRDRRLKIIEDGLREAADPLIGKAAGDWRAEFYRVQSLDVQFWKEGTGRFERISGKEIFREFSNGPEIKSLLEKIQQAQRALEDLVLSESENVEAEIERITKDLPGLGKTTNRFGINEEGK